MIWWHLGQGHTGSKHGLQLPLQKEELTLSDETVLIHQAYPYTNLATASTKVSHGSKVRSSDLRVKYMYYCYVGSFHKQGQQEDLV